MFALVVDAHAEEGSGAVGFAVMRALSRQVGQEYHTFGTGYYAIRALVKFLPTGVQYPANPVEYQSGILHSRHRIPIDFISRSIEMRAACWIGDGFRGKLDY